MLSVLGEEHEYCYLLLGSSSVSLVLLLEALDRCGSLSQNDLKLPLRKQLAAMNG